MCVSSDRPLTIIAWVRRLLFLTLFLFLLLATNLYHFPITFAYVGAVVSLIITALFLLRDFEEEVDMNTEDISPVDADVI